MDKQTRNINEALLEAQRKIGVATKGASNPFFGSKYADLGEVMKVIKEPLNSAGLSVTQSVGYTYTPSGETLDVLTTTLRHVGGEVIESIARIPPSKDIQKFGGAITYMRRYTLQAMLFISAEDDDGNSNVKQPKKTESLKFT